MREAEGLSQHTVRSQVVASTLSLFHTFTLSHASTDGQSVKTNICLFIVYFDTTPSNYFRLFICVLM